MPCTKCNADFNLLNWKIKCGECDEKFCNKCLKKQEGVLFCEKCIILLRRPPDRGKLMELKSKDLQDYLKKHNISTHGLVEKRELVDLFCNKHIPVKQRKGAEKLTANFGCSLPNFRENSTLGELWGTIGSDSFWSGSSDRNRNNSQQNPRGNTRTPKPPPRKSPKNSPTSTTADFQTPPTSAEQFSTASSTQEDRQPASTSSESTLGSEWVYVNRVGSTEDISHQNTPEGSPLPPKCPKLSELQSEEEINQLNAKQLKTLLFLNRVDYKGCVEKKELLDKVVTLWRDNKTKREELPEEVEDLCKLCMDAPLDCVLLECGHIATCIDCGKQLAECPICRQYVSRVVRTFKA